MRRYHGLHETRRYFMHWVEMGRNIKDVVGMTGLALEKVLLVENIVTGPE